MYSLQQQTSLLSPMNLGETGFKITVCESTYQEDSSKTPLEAKLGKKINE